MARVRTIVPISGKLGENEYVNSTAYGTLVRKAATAGSKKEQPVLKQNYARTGFLNRVASQLNNIFKIYCTDFKTPGLYTCMLTLFRKEAVDNRFLLLLQLKGLEINPRYPLGRLGQISSTVSAVKNKIVVNLTIQSHPSRGRHHADCYQYEVMLIHWNSENEAATVSRMRTGLLDIGGNRFEFDFRFPKPVATTHWVLCLRQQLGVNGHLLEMMVTQGVQIVDVGTFDKTEQALLIQRKEEKLRRPEKKIGEMVDDIPVVKAKKILI